MSVTAIKNTGAGAVNGGNNGGNNGVGNGDLNFQAQLEALKLASLQATQNSVQLRALSLQLGSLGQAGREKPNG